jgi:hypothetical protein
VGSVSEVRKWEVWLAEVPFEDIDGSKLRPVIIMNDYMYQVECIKLTGQRPRAGEYKLLDWESAGLHKLTVARISQVRILDKSRFRQKIGKLKRLDRLNLQKLIG